VKRFRGGLVFKAHRLCVSLNSRLESNKEEENAIPVILHGAVSPEVETAVSLSARGSTQILAGEEQRLDTGNREVALHLPSYNTGNAPGAVRVPSSFFFFITLKPRVE